MKKDLYTLWWLVFIFCILLVCFNQTNIIIYAEASINAIVNKNMTKTPIDHVIVILQGKRSFDNYFGTFSGVNGITNDTQIGQGPFPLGLVEYTISLWFKTSHDFSKTGMIITKG